MTAIVFVGVPVVSKLVGLLGFYLLPFCLLALLALHPKATRAAAWIGGALVALIIARITYIVCIGCCTYFWCDWI